VKMKRK